jgi:putative transposase
VLKAYEYRIYPTDEQKMQIAQHIGCARWIYNYALEKKSKAWSESRKNLSRFDIQKDLPKLKKQEETKWLVEVNSQTLQASLEHLEHAYKRFFKEKKGFPKFKSKHNNRQSFSVPQHVSVDFENGLINLPKMEPIKVKFHRQFEGKIKTVTVKKTPTNKYFVSILVESIEEPKKKKAVKEKTTIGIDMGIKDFATLSSGEKVENPKTLKKSEKKLTKAQRKLSRKVKGSKNRNKQRVRVAKVYETISNTRKDFLHKLSHKLTHENQVDSIVIEDLNVSGMMRNHRLAKSIGDCSWSEFVRQLEYKSEWYGKNLIKIGRFEPSSKTCNQCGAINHDLKLSDREWTCKSCGTNHDRDVNAAINIKNIGLHPSNRVPTECGELTPVESRCRNATR